MQSLDEAGRQRLVAGSSTAVRATYAAKSGRIDAIASSTDSRREPDEPRLLLADRPSRSQGGSSRGVGAGEATVTTAVTRSGCRAATASA